MRDEHVDRDPPHYHNPYGWLARWYDGVARALLAPVGGEERIRARALDLLALRPGERVLELGCGTGAMTERILAAGAEVVPVDLSEPMLRRARRRLPQVEFLRRDLLSLDDQAAFDAALFALVLHEMSDDVRRRALQVAHRALRPGGRLLVLDFAAPGGALGAALSAWLLLTEPPCARRAASHLPEEIESAGFRIQARRPLAAGALAAYLAVVS